MDERRDIFRDLDAEWRFVVIAPATSARLAIWRDRHECLRQTRSLGDVVEQIQRGAPTLSWATVWALLDEACADPLAQRTLLQTIVPGLVREAARLGANGGARDATARSELEQIVVVAAHHAILRTAGQRPEYPVNQLLRCTRRKALRDLGVQHRWHTEATGLDSDLEPAQPECDPRPEHELAEVLRDACASGSVTRRDAELVWLTRVNGIGMDRLEHRFGATADSLRRRRHRAESRLANAARAS